MEILDQPILELKEEDECIGMCIIGNLLLKNAQYNEDIGNDEIQKESLFQALEINHLCSDLLEELAILYEVKEHDFTTAEHYYRSSLECEPISETVLYNFANFFETKKQYGEMLEYYTQAAMQGDPEAFMRISLYWKNVEPNTENMLNALRECIEVIYSDQHQEKERIQREKKINDKKVFRSTEGVLINTFTPLILFDHIQNFESLTPNIQKCLRFLKTYPAVMIYETKLRLFQRLNNMADCGICMETKINIDLYCGHEVCLDCYKMVFENNCPFCRIMPPREFNHGCDCDSSSEYSSGDEDQDEEDEDDDDYEEDENGEVINSLDEID